MLPSERATEDHSYGSHIEYTPPMPLWVKSAQRAGGGGVYQHPPSNSHHPHHRHGQHQLGWRESAKAASRRRVARRWWENVAAAVYVSVKDTHTYARTQASTRVHKRKRTSNTRTQTSARTYTCTRTRARLVEIGRKVGRDITRIADGVGWDWWSCVCLCVRACIRSDRDARAVNKCAPKGRCTDK